MPESASSAAVLIVEDAPETGGEPGERGRQIRSEMDEHQGRSPLFTLADNLIGTADTRLGVVPAAGNGESKP